MDLLTVKEAAERLRLSQGAVYMLCENRKLPHLRLGVGRGVIRIRAADLAAFIETAKVEPCSPVTNAASLKHIKMHEAESP
jgi:excisionase family DNA binding protein